MGSLKNTIGKVYNLSPNIILSIDDKNMGEMYVYDNLYGYCLNSMTASDLVDYFAYKNQIHISDEILDTIMSITGNKGTQ